MAPEGIEILRAIGQLAERLEEHDRGSRERADRIERYHSENRRSLEDLGRAIRELAASIESSRIRASSAWWIALGMVAGASGSKGMDALLKALGWAG